MQSRVPPVFAARVLWWFKVNLLFRWVAPPWSGVCSGSAPAVGTSGFPLLNFMMFSPFLQLVKVSLDSVMTLWHISQSSQFVLPTNFLRVHSALSSSEGIFLLLMKDPISVHLEILTTLQKINVNGIITGKVKNLVSLFPLSKNPGYRQVPQGTKEQNKCGKKAEQRWYRAN